MPTIPIFFGIIVQMYWRDHAPPHVHAFYQGQEALFAISSGDVIAGRLTPAATRLMQEWIAKNAMTCSRTGSVGHCASHSRR
jgi:Domain of unknown function (DUF4160)